jgi:hypothetical protein
MKLLCMFLLAAAAFAEPRIFYSKSFPGSTPPYAELTIQQDGSVVYKESSDDELPVKFKIEPAEAAEIFALAGKLDRFGRPVESGLPVARMGEKTYRWEDPPAPPREVKYNYSTDTDVQAIQAWFEKMVETVQLYLNLERAAKFDKLGANHALLLVQSAFERQRLVAPNQFLPLLDRVTKNSSYLNMARERAAAIATAIRANAAKAE